MSETKKNGKKNEDEGAVGARGYAPPETDRKPLRQSYSNLNWRANTKDPLTALFQQSQDCTVFSYVAMLCERVPPEVSLLSRLQELNFGFNKLSTLPDEIGELTQLKTLNICQNKFTSIPNGVWKITSLTQLNAAGNQIESLPHELGNLIELTQLNMDDNKLTTLPTSIEKLKKLQHLHLHKNNFTSLPSTIGRLESLLTLLLQENKLTSLPSDLAQLTSLRNLFVQDNQLTSLPPSIGHLSQMWFLNISNNNLDTLPSSLGRLSHVLSNFVYSGNSLKEIPTQLHSNPKAILKYLEKELPPDVVVSAPTLPADLKCLVNNRDFSDVIFKVNGAEIFAHKCILYARRSRYHIEKLFPGFQLKEMKKVVEVEINLQLSLFLELLEFIYTGDPASIKTKDFKQYLTVDIDALKSNEKIWFNQLTEDLRILYNNREFSDLNFDISGHLIPAHKAILRCRCSPFAAMLTSSFQESKQKIITIPPEEDISIEIFMNMMEFIYTSNCEVSGDNAVELLAAANLYQLHRLKEMCEKEIEQGVDDTNRLQLLSIANTYSALQLEEYTMHTIVNMKDDQFENFRKTPEYLELNDEIRTIIQRKREIKSISFPDVLGVSQNFVKPVPEIRTALSPPPVRRDIPPKTGFSFQPSTPVFNIQVIPPSPDTEEKNKETTAGSLMDRLTLSPTPPRREKSPSRSSSRSPSRSSSKSPNRSRSPRKKSPNKSRSSSPRPVVQDSFSFSPPSD